MSSQLSLKPVQNIDCDRVPVQKAKVVKLHQKDTESASNSIHEKSCRKLLNLTFTVNLSQSTHWRKGHWISQRHRENRYAKTLGI